MFIEILFKMLLFKGGVLIYAEHCICVCVCVSIVTGCKNHMTRRAQTNTPEGAFIHIERVQSEEWLAEEVRCSPWLIFFGAVSQNCARGRAGSFTRWRLKSRRVGTLFICIEETSLSITQPHTAYLATGKRTSGVADPAVMSGCRCFASVSRATLMSVRQGGNWGWVGSDP